MCSAYGFQDAPIEVLHMLVNDIHDGDLDSEIKMRRPDLAEQ